MIYFAYEYKMPVAMAKEFLKDCKNMDTNKYLCNIVNENFGIKGTCVKVIING